VVDYDTLHSLLKVKVVEVVEGHQMSVSSENEHLVAQNVYRLAVTGARLLADYETMALVVYYFLSDLVFVVFLNT